MLNCIRRNIQRHRAVYKRQHGFLVCLRSCVTGCSGFCIIEKDNVVCFVSSACSLQANYFLVAFGLAFHHCGSNTFGDGKIQLLGQLQTRHGTLHAWAQTKMRQLTFFCVAVQTGRILDATIKYLNTNYERMFIELQDYKSLTTLRKVSFS